jgi:hypothetical protein
MIPASKKPCEVDERAIINPPGLRHPCLRMIMNDRNLL